MLKILIVDDRADVRELLRDMIQEHLPAGSEVQVEDGFPLEEVDGYASYIREHILLSISVHIPSTLYISL